MTTVFQLAVRVPQALAEAVSDWLETIALAVTIDLHDDHAKVAGLFTARPDDVLLRQQLTALAPGLVHDWQQLPATDWLATTARQGAGTIGSFTLLDAPAAVTALLSQRALYVESAHAFGDGFHATTHGCLLALADLHKQTRIKSFADVGCGTGVLALAARKLWPQARGVLGDIDAMAIAVTRRNARQNGGTHNLCFTVGAGLAVAPFKRHAPFDLILANILAGPLCRLAPAVSKALAPGGHIILSGLLENQKTAVVSAYRQQGLRLVKSYARHGWLTLVLRK